jgi:tetratricopeptide (TPR) repeat protein
VALFGRKTYDRGDTLARAAKAEGKRQRKKAIVLYREVLEQEPENPVVLAKLGALLARTKQSEEARKKFLAAAEVYEKQAFDDKALATYAQAAGFLPARAELWEQIAKLNVKRARPADAIRALRDGAAHQRGRKLRANAVRLLREAVRVEPWHFEATLELARLLRKQGKRADARKLYEGLCARKRGVQLRKARGAWFRMSPTPANAWRWARAAFSRRGGG